MGLGTQGQQQQQQRRQQQQEPQLSAAELLHDAQLARLSGLCYRPADVLAAHLEQAGLRLVAQGRSWCTRWYAVDRVPPTSGSSGTSASNGSTSTAGSSSTGIRGSDIPTQAAVAAPVPERLIFSRGVSWGSPDLDAMRVWRGLLNAWPSPFLPDRTRPRGALVAHRGVAEMAEELWEDLRPHIAGAPGTIQLAGHSLGGSLSLLLACMAQLELGVPGSRLGCATFGSPPVLSLSQGAEGGSAILAALGMAPGAVRNYVLDDDPVPRVLLTADPSFQVLKASPAAAALLQLRERVLGPGAVLSPSRFLYHTVGAVLLLRWSPERGYSIRRLAADQLAKELAMDVEALRAQPMRLLQALLDHHHSTYTEAIQASAAALARQGDSSSGREGGRLGGC